MLRKFVVIFVAAILTACGAQASVEGAAVEIEQFHQRLDDGKIDAIWSSADKQFHDATPKEEFDKFLNAVHEKLGKTVSSEQTGWKVNATTGGTFVIVGRATQFERGSGDETFTFIEDGKSLNLVGYNIASTDMMIN